MFEIIFRFFVAEAGIKVDKKMEQPSTVEEKVSIYYHIFLINPRNAPKRSK